MMRLLVAASHHQSSSYGSIGSQKRTRGIRRWKRSLSLTLAIVGFSSPHLVCTAMSSSSSNNSYKIIDSHLHVWADTTQSTTTFPYDPTAPPPPDALRDAASTTELCRQMDTHGVEGALIVQPIHHKYTHSYILDAVAQHPDRFKAMLLHDPSQSIDEAVRTLEVLAEQGCVGVRYNPYLWGKDDSNKKSDKNTGGGDGPWKSMCDDAGMAVYRRCGALGLPVGVMCFQGLPWHYDDLIQFCTDAPETTLIVDHCGFCGVDDDKAFAQLLSLAKYPAVHVKVSALFRLGDVAPYDTVRDTRFQPLLEAFGARRLLYGSDFPFVLEQPGGYGAAKDIIASWCATEEDRREILGGTTARLFGAWGETSKV